jgi:pimeloyl-ACP methyl ester carboxylesterase
MEQQAALSQWASSGNGGIDGHLDPKIAFGRAPYLKPEPAWIDAQMTIGKAILPELYRDHLSERIGTTRIPLLVIVGSRDLIVPPASLRAGYARWGGPKSFVEMPASHHLPFADEPVRFVELVTAFSEGKPVPQ